MLLFFKIQVHTQMQNLNLLTEVKISQSTEVVQKSGNLYLASGTSTTSIVFADFMTSYWLRTFPLWYPHIDFTVSTEKSSLLYKY